MLIIPNLNSLIKMFLMLKYNYCHYPFVFKFTVYRIEEKNSEAHHYVLIKMSNYSTSTCTPEQALVGFFAWLSSLKFGYKNVNLFFHFSFKQKNFDTFPKYLCFLVFMTADLINLSWTVHDRKIRKRLTGFPFSMCNGHKQTHTQR